MNIVELKEKISLQINMIGSRKIIIWGAGAYGQLVATALKELGVEFDAFVDQNHGNQHDRVFNRQILSPQQLEQLKSSQYYVLVALMYRYQHVDYQLQGYGFNDEHDYYQLSNVLSVTVDPIQKYIDDNGNSINGIPSVSYKSKIIFQGKNNKILFNSKVTLKNTTIIFHGNNGSCVFGMNSLYTGGIEVGSECTVSIGQNLTVIENCFITTAENTKVEIGNHCMFVSNNQIKCHDYHPIFNVQTGQRVNTSQSIIIGNHVLLEPSAILLASAVVNDGSIISQGSIVKSEIPKSSMAAGIPARVVKQKITWDRAAWKSSGAF